jgi:hypothetical protein
MIRERESTVIKALEGTGDARKLKIEGGYDNDSDSYAADSVVVVDRSDGSSGSSGSSGGSGGSSRDRAVSVLSDKSQSLVCNTSKLGTTTKKNPATRSSADNDCSMNSGTARIRIAGRHLLKAFSLTRSSISDKDRSFYEEVYSKFRHKSDHGEPKSADAAAFDITKQKLTLM